MSGFLVDTNVISEILRPSPNAQVSDWSLKQAKQGLFLSVISLGELRKGISIMPLSSRRTQLEQSIKEQIPLWFEGRILPVTQLIAERWGALEGQRQLVGRPLGAAGGLIAATALEHGLTLVTRNVKDFEGLGVALINPWEAAG